MASSKNPPPPSDLIAHLKQALARIVSPGQRLSLGLSGGIDSLVLLDILAQLRETLGFHLSAIHINHQISPNASAWARFCQEQCAGRGIALNVVTVDLLGRRQLGLEAAARAARYHAFDQQQADFIVLAHHLDDQVETLLLQMLRGAGVKGLSAMPQNSDKRSSTKPSLLRPLLGIPRSTIETYARNRSLQWVEDESNIDISYGRNFLRHEIFPKLETHFPAYRKTLFRVSRNLSESAQLQDELAQLDAQSVLLQGKLDAAKLASLGVIRAKNLMRYYLAQHEITMPSAQRLEEIVRQLGGAAEDASVHIKIGEFEIRRFRNQVSVHPLTKAIAIHPHWEWRGEPELSLPEMQRVLAFQPTVGQGLSLTKLQQQPVTIRLRQGGERLKPDCHRPRRSLKNLLQEAQIPPWQRQRLPLLYCGDQLTMVLGIGIDCAYQAAPDEPGVLVAFLNPL